MEGSSDPKKDSDCLTIKTESEVRCRRARQGERRAVCVRVSVIKQMVKYSRPRPAIMQILRQTFPGDWSAAGLTNTLTDRLSL